MRRLLNRLNKNLLLKVAGFNSIQVLIKIGIGAAMSKIIAFYVGPAGLALMGNLRNFSQSISTIATLGLENGIVKKTAEYQSLKEKLFKTLNAGWSHVFVLSIILAIMLAGFHDTISRWLFFNQEYDGVLLMLVLSLPLFSVFIFISSVLQGLELFKRYITLNIIMSLAMFIVSASLAVNYGTSGALYALAVVPYLQFTIAVIYATSLSSELGFKLLDLFRFDFDREYSNRLLKFSFLALFSAFAVPFVNILVRKELQVELGDDQAGFWEAMVRISTYYMMFATSLISMYVLPGFSKDDSAANFRKVAGNFYKTILPLVVLGLMTVYLCRELLVLFLFNEDFLPMTQLFKWQLSADFVRIVTFVLAFRFIALNDIKRYLIAEVLSIASFYILSVILIEMYGLEGVTMAYLGNYIFYAIVLVILLRKELFSRK
jgi:PST family polysaccharide transporter